MTSGITWQWVLCEPGPSTVEIRDLAHAYGRRVTWRVDGICDAQFSLPGGAPEAVDIEELATDLIIYRHVDDGVNTRKYRGRIITEVDTLSDLGDSTQFSSIDYRGMLQHRVIRAASAENVSQDLGTINWQFISDTQTELPNSNWGITNGVGSSAGYNALTENELMGANVMDVMNDWARRVDGFEWEIDANLAFNRWYPTRGTSTGAKIDYGGKIVAARKTLTPNTFANLIIVTGADITFPVTRTSATQTTDPQGRWDLYFGYPEIRAQSVLGERADWVIDQTSKIKSAWVVQLAPGAWDPETMWLGDIISLYVIHGRHNVQALMRIIEVQVVINDEGVELVTLGLEVP